MNSGVRSLGGLLVALLAGAAGCSRAPSERPPNILVVFTDDQRVDTISALGPSPIRTPNIDRLASEGVTFTESFVTTSLCSPSRATLVTGKYVHVHGVLSNREGADFLERHWNVAQLLQGAGYETGFFGKWHVGTTSAEPQPGFDRWVSFTGKEGYRSTSYVSHGGRTLIGGRINPYSTNHLVRCASAWIEEERERPFFALLSLKNCHRPFDPERRFLDEVVRAPIPPRPVADITNLPEFLQAASRTGRNAYFEEEGPYEGAYRRYLALALGIDDAVGRLLETLEQLGQLENTVVLFTSDNGYLWGEHGLYRKRASFEPSIRVPLIVRWPAEIAADSRRSELALNVDLAPTLLDLAGVPVPADAQGRSLRPLWRDEARRDEAGDWRTEFAVLDSYDDPARGPAELALRTERWKYVRFRSPRVEELLYDLASDPDETTDLAADPDQAERLAELRAALRAELARIDAPPDWWDALP